MNLCYPEYMLDIGRSCIITADTMGMDIRYHHEIIIAQRRHLENRHAFPISSTMTQKEVIVTGRWSLESLEVLISSRSSIADAGKRVAYISGQFLGVRYQEST